MKIKNLSLLIAALIPFIALSQKDNQWISKAEKIDQLYQDGSYKTALRKLHRLEKKHTKDSVNLHLLPVTLAMKAQNLNAVGKPDEAITILLEADSMWNTQQLDSLQTDEFYGNLYFSKAWAEFHYSLKGLDYLDEASDLLTDKIDPKGTLKRKIAAQRIDLQFQRHDYLALRELLDSQLSEEKELRKKTHKVYNEKKQTYDEKKVKRKERLANLYWLADLKVQYGRLQLEQGKVAEADSLFEGLKKELPNYVKRRHLPAIELNFYRAMVYDYMGEYRKAAKYYRKTRRYYARKVKYDVPNKFYFEIFDEEINALVDNHKFNKADKAARQYNRESVKNFGRKSTHRLQAKTIQQYEEIEKRKYVKGLKRSTKVYEDALEAHPEIHAGLIPELEQMEFLEIKNNNFNNAQEIRYQINSILDSLHGKQAPIYHESLLKLAEIQTYYTFKLSDADSIYQSSFDTVIKQQLDPFHPEYIAYLNGYGRLEVEMDEFDEALDKYNQGKEIAIQKFGEESSEHADELAKIAEVQIIKGEFLKAEETLTKAYELIKASHAKKTIANYNTLVTLGELQTINGKFNEAQITLKYAMNIGKKLGLEVNDIQASSMQDLAEIYIETGRYKEAEDLLQKNILVQSMAHGNNYYKLIEPYASLGMLFLIKGDFVNAEKNVKQSLSIADSVLSDTSRKYIDNLISLGDVYYNMGDYDKALSIYNESIEKTKNVLGDKHIQIGDIQVKSAQVMIARHDSAQTIISELDSAIFITEQAIGSFHPKYANAIELKAQVLIQLEQYDVALKLLKEADSIYVESYGKNHIKTANNAVLVADLYYSKKEYDQAEVYYRDAMGTFKKIFNDQHPKYTATLSKLGKNYYAAGDIKKATKTFDQTTSIYLEYINLYFPSLTENQKSKYWNKIRTDFEIFNSLAVSNHEENPKLLAKMYEYKLATKALLLSSSIKIKEQIAASNDLELIELYDDWVAKREMLTQALSMTFEEQKVNGINTKELESYISDVEVELSERSQLFENNMQQRLYSWKEVKEQLGEQDAAIEIIRFNYFTDKFTDSVIYAALVITSESKKAPTLVTLENGNDLEGKYFKYYRNTIKLKTKDKYSYGKFWAKIDGALAGKKNIYLSSDGVYNQLNPETLKQDDDTYLIDKYTFYNVSNTKDLVINAEKEPELYLTNSANLFGNPLFSSVSDTADVTTASVERSVGNKVSSVEPLPGAEKEVADLSSFLKTNNWETETHLLADATEENIKKMNNPRVFHVATHGFFVEESSITKQNEMMQDEVPTDNPLLKSGLLFVGADELLQENNIFQFNKKDGILTAYEAMNLRLDNTELVVLSACETGLGEVKSGEGVYGLQRSFLVAGAQNVIMTLFKVNDEVTQKLMNTFYQKWLETGDKRKAFIEAKKMIKDEYDSPIYWGSFVLIGLD